jgi:PleD family two-component response regulator
MLQTSVVQKDILVVDDTLANLRLLTQMLSNYGYRVRPVTDGAQALLTVRSTPPNLILLDIRMPDMSGYEVCKRLKSDPRTRDIPVIFLSALGETEDKVKAFAVGGVDYVTKPFQVEEVLARVQTHLALRALQRQLEEANLQLAAQNAELAMRNTELQEALSTIKTLSGLVPICAWCGRMMQNEAGAWVDVEAYIREHSEAEFTHGICPDCFGKLNKK